jgi:hypothetical protein
MCPSLACSARPAPNPSVKPTRDGRPHRPRGAHANVAPHSRHTLPSRAAYLER